jgi:hypothetical protein
MRRETCRNLARDPRTCALALLAAPLVLAARAAALVDCEGLPGNWSGFSGSTLVDHYTVDWRPAAGAGAFWVNTTAATHEDWHYAECQLAASNLSASCFFPEKAAVPSAGTTRRPSARTHR